jgi:hypothetical protein
MESPNTDEFDWGTRGESFWRDIQKAAATRSALALKFVASKEQGKSNTEAARRAGAGGAPNAAGYRLSRSNEVARLFAVLQAETGTDVGHVDGAESKRILSQLARGSDPSVRIRAVEALQKIQERELERDVGDPPPEEILRRLIESAGTWGALAAAGTYISQHGTLQGFPLAREVLPIVKTNYPEAWQQMLESFPPKHRHHRPTVEALANAPVLTTEQIVGVKPNGSDPEGGEIETVN